MAVLDAPLPDAVLRKTGAALRRIPRAHARACARPDAYAARPPIVVNSLPKSGTHLMMQIAAALPGARAYGSFIAQRASWSCRHRDQAQIDARIARIAPAEVLGAHLHHTPRTEAALQRLNALHIFIHRDPRAVLVSEVQYLARTARWNALHARFAGAGDFAAQIDLAIRGDGTEALPDIATRYAPYLAWRDAPGVLAVRFEDLMDPVQRHAVLTGIARAHAARSGQPFDAGLPARLQDAIRPEGSHTFTGRDPNRWRRNLSLDQQTRLAWMA